MSLRVDVTLKKKKEVRSISRRMKIIRCIADLPKRFAPRFKLHFPICFNSTLIKAKFSIFHTKIVNSFSLTKALKKVLLKAPERIQFIYSTKNIKLQKFSKVSYNLNFNYSCILSKLKTSDFSSHFFTTFNTDVKTVLHTRLFDYDSSRLSMLDNHTLNELDYIIK